MTEDNKPWRGQVDLHMLDVKTAVRHLKEIAKVIDALKELGTAGAHDTIELLRNAVIRYAKGSSVYFDAMELLITAEVLPQRFLDLFYESK